MRIYIAGKTAYLENAESSTIEFIHNYDLYGADEMDLPLYHDEERNADYVSIPIANVSAWTIECPKTE